MELSLITEQVESYRRDGYLFPLDVFASGQVDAIRAELEQARRGAVALGAGADQEMLAAY
jgi:hypothetical protein